jgi:hypothetical protein
MASFVPSQRVLQTILITSIDVNDVEFCITAAADIIVDVHCHIVCPAFNRHR